jgi:lambda family phage tail tape measure protein
MSDVIGRGVIDLEANSTGLEAGMAKGEAAVQRFETAAKKSAAGAAGAFKDTEKTFTGAGASMDAASRRFLTSLERESAQVGRTRGEYLEYRAAQLGIGGAASQFIAKIKASEGALKGAGISAGQTAQAYRQLPAQITDVATSLASGSPAWLVAIQQGGQIKDSFGGIGPAVKALLSLFTPLRLALGTIGIAGGAVAFAFTQGRSETTEYAKAITLSGNAANVTTDRLAGMARAVSQSVGTQGAAAEVLTHLVNTGRVVGTSLGGAAEAAIRLERIGGPAIAKTVDQFAELGKSPVEASLKLNETYNYLSASVFRQIKLLQDQGRTADAARLAQETYASAVISRTQTLEQGLGTLQKAWLGVGDYAKKAWDAMLGIGREKTIEQQLAELDSKLANFDANRVLMSRGGKRQSTLETERAQLQAQRDTVAESGRLAGRGTLAQGAATAGNQARIKLVEELDAALTPAQKLNKELERNKTLVKDANGTRQDLEKLDAASRRRFSTLDTRKPTLDKDLAEIQAGLKQMTTAYSGAEQILEATRSAGLVSEREYYDAKRAFVLLNEQAEVSALERENARILQANKTADPKDREENNKKIIENNARIAEAQLKAAAATETLGIQGKAAGQRIADSFRDARLALVDYLDEARRSQGRDLAGFGLSNDERTRRAGRAQIEDRFSAQQRDVLRARADSERNGDTDAVNRFDGQLASIREFREKALSEFDVYYARRKELEADASLGAKAALADYLEESRKAGDQAYQVWSDAFKGIEDALTSFVTTGKADFKGLVQSIIAEVVRMQIIKPMLADIFGGSNGNGGLAAWLKLVGGTSGGTVSGSINPGGDGGYAGQFKDGGTLGAGQWGIAGEAGPEIVRGPAQIVPTSRMGGGSINFAPVTHINVDSRSDRAAVTRDTLSIVQANNREMLEQLKAAGVIR